MMKNIILAILAILFIIIILFHFMNVQMEHFDCKSQSDKDKVSAIFYNVKIDPSTIININNIIKNRGIYSDDAIMQSLINMNIADTNLNKILSNTSTEYITSTDKLDAFVCGLKQKEKDLLDDNLLIHYPLDKIGSNNIIKNESINVLFADANNSYDGTLKGTVKPELTGDDTRGTGNASMKFGGTSPTNGGYIEINNSLPTFWKKDNKNFMGMSIAVWVKATKQNNNWSKIFDFAAGDSYSHNIFATVTNTHDNREGNLALAIFNGDWKNPDVLGGLDYIESSVLDDVWRHYIFTISPSNSDNSCQYKLYINGKFQTSNYVNFGIVTNSDGVQTTNTWNGPDPKNTRYPDNIKRTQNFIGKSNFSFDSYFNGIMADFRIYTKELDQTTVDLLYKYVNPVISISTMSVEDVLKQASSSWRTQAGIGGSPMSVNFLLDASLDEYITNDTNGLLVWKDLNNNNDGKARDNNVSFCSVGQKVTVPPGSCIDIPMNAKMNYGAPFTIILVADVKSFNPPSNGKSNMQRLIGSPDYNGLEFGFVGNNILVNVQNAGGALVPLNLSSLGTDGNGPNVYTVMVDANGNVNAWINSNPVISNRTTVYNSVPLNKPILLGCAFGPNQYPSAQNIDYYRILHLSGTANLIWIQLVEAYFANKCGFKSKINSNNNPFITFNFT